MLRPVLGISLDFMNRLSNEYFEPSLCVVDKHCGSGSTSCPADRDLRELAEGEETRSPLQM